MANDDFGYQRITVDRPLRQRFEITEDTLAALNEARQLAKYAHRNTLMDALKPLTGTTWASMGEAKAGLESALAEAELDWPDTIDKAIWAAISVSDPNGELQTKKGAPLPTRACEATRTSRWQRTLMNTSPGRSCPTSPMPGLSR